VSIDKRNGTTTLFALLNLLGGKVTGECHSNRQKVCKVI